MGAPFERLPIAELIKLAHLVAAIVWMGGMAFMLFALRPAIVAQMEPPQRLALMGAVWQRFFAVVAGAIVVLFATGTSMYTALLGWPPVRAACRWAGI